jgi:hypothetical protein
VEMLDFFHGCGYPCPEHSNPFDFYSKFFFHIPYRKCFLVFLTSDFCLDDTSEFCFGFCFGVFYFSICESINLPSMTYQNEMGARSQTDWYTPTL